MTGDPRCLVCDGRGTVRDSAGRDEVCPCTNGPRRDPYAEPKAGWLGEVVPDILRIAAQGKAAAEAHAASCTDRPCKRCERNVCPCGAPFDGWGKQCHACADRAERLEALKAVHESIPKRFRWALGAELGVLRGRVRGSDELIYRALANPPGTDLLLMGDTAAGKTSLAIAMLDAWVRQDTYARKGARFVESYWLAGARGRHPLGQGEAPLVREAMGATLLVLDDLGSEVGDHRNVIADVIFHRHNEELPTWITTGWTPEQLMERYGSQVVRRVVEHGKRVTLGGKT
jgi:hypothetical protein